MGQAVNGMARLIMRPFFIDVFVDTRDRAQDCPAPAIEADVGSHSVHHVNRGGLFQFPRPRLKSVRLACQRTDRAQINHIA